MGTTNQAKDKEPQTSNPWFGVYRNDEITKQFGGGVRTFQDSGFVMLCNSGSVVMSVNGVKYKIERNHLFVVYPRVDVSLYDITEDFDGVLLEINVNMVNRIDYACAQSWAYAVLIFVLVLIVNAIVSRRVITLD